MPPRVRYSRESVVQAAFDIAREKGEQAINARAIADALGCSTQPLFREFQSMEQIRAEVLKLAEEEYRRYVARGASASDKPYKGSGTAYILFAKQEPELFKMLFMRDRTGEPRDSGKGDPAVEPLLQMLMQSSGYTREQALTFHLHMWIYVHGLATMVATKYVDFTDDEISYLMSEEFEAMRALYISRIRSAEV